MPKRQNHKAPTKPPILAILHMGEAPHELNFELWRGERLPKAMREKWYWFCHQASQVTWACRGTITSPKDTAVKALLEMATHVTISGTQEQTASTEALIADYLVGCPLTLTQGRDDFEAATGDWCNRGDLHLLITREPKIGLRWSKIQPGLAQASPKGKEPWMLYGTKHPIELQGHPQHDVLLIANPKVFFRQRPALLSATDWLLEVLGWIDGRILVLPVTEDQIPDFAHMAKDAWRETTNGKVVHAPELLHTRH